MNLRLFIPYSAQKARFESSCFKVILSHAGKLLIYSAVARGGAGGARAPPVFFLESKNRPV